MPALLNIGTAGVDLQVIGNGPLDLGNRFDQGARLTLGFWVDPHETLGIEGSYLMFFETNPSFTVASAGGNPPLAIPFFNNTLGTEDPTGKVIAAPGVSEGTVTISALSRLWGAEINSRLVLLRNGCGHLDFLFGVNYLELDENLNMTSTKTPGNDADSVLTSDRFGTHNRFIGGQVGLEGELFLRNFFIHSWAKFALGQNQELVRIQGNRVSTTAGVSTNVDGGLFAQPTNIGEFKNDRLTAMGQAGINVGYQVGRHIRLMGGYSILYINNVVRPGDQIDRVIDPPPTDSASQPPGSTRPRFPFQETGYWAQGFNLGVEFRY